MFRVPSVTVDLTTPEENDDKDRSKLEEPIEPVEPVEVQEVQKNATSSPRRPSKRWSPDQFDPDLSQRQVLRIPASAVALVTGLHQYSERLVENFLEHLYQDMQEELLRDCTACNLQLVSQEEQIQNLIAQVGGKEGAILKAARLDAHDGKKMNNVVKVAALQTKVSHVLKTQAVQSSLMTRDLNLLEREISQQINTGFGNRNEAEAVGYYEVQTGRKVHAQNDALFVLHFPAPPGIWEQLDSNCSIATLSSQWRENGIQGVLQAQSLKDMGPPSSLLFIPKQPASRKDSLAGALKSGLLKNKLRSQSRNMQAYSHVVERISRKPGKKLSAEVSIKMMTKNKFKMEADKSTTSFGLVNDSNCEKMRLFCGSDEESDVDVGFDTIDPWCSYSQRCLNEPNCIDFAKQARPHHKIKVNGVMTSLKRINDSSHLCAALKKINNFSSSCKHLGNKSVDLTNNDTPHQMKRCTGCNGDGNGCCMLIASQLSRADRHRLHKEAQKLGLGHGTVPLENAFWIWDKFSQNQIKDSPAESSNETDNAKFVITECISSIDRNHSSYCRFLQSVLRNMRKRRTQGPLKRQHGSGKLSCGTFVLDMGNDTWEDAYTKYVKQISPKERRPIFFKICGKIDGLTVEAKNSLQTPSTFKCHDHRRKQVGGSSDTLVSSYRPVYASVIDQLGFAFKQISCQPPISKFTDAQLQIMKVNRKKALQRKKCRLQKKTGNLDARPKFTVVEIKNRMKSIKRPPPLYDQVQCMVYMLMLRCTSADLVQYLKNKHTFKRSRGDRSLLKIEKDDVYESSFSIDRVSLHGAPYNHSHNWDHEVLPRLYAYSTLIAKFRRNRDLRLAFLASGEQAQKQALIYELPFL